ncbi:hypothetical protein MKX29_24360 [Cytobacillus sp. FSL R7-0696]|uniref:hypothetical protein n=1 Tax=Cytobacillus sp. FSL R7-0696 TaxID=2921691 RepID=UPI0030F9F521
MSEIKLKWQRIDESVQWHNRTGEEFYSYTVTPDMTREVLELIAEVERLRYVNQRLEKRVEMYCDM